MNIFIFASNRAFILIKPFQNDVTKVQQYLIIPSAIISFNVKTEIKVNVNGIDSFHREISMLVEVADF